VYIESKRKPECLIIIGMNSSSLTIKLQEISLPQEQLQYSTIFPILQFHTNPTSYQVDVQHTSENHSVKFVVYFIFLLTLGS
jgi:hypothetical protein